MNIAAAAASRMQVGAPIALLTFVAALTLTAAAVRHGLVADDMLRLWAGASAAADGQVAIGRIVAGYPTLPFLTTTLVAWIVPAGAPGPVLVAAALLAAMAVFCFRALRRAGFRRGVAAAATLLIAFHPALLRALVGGPADMFLAAVLLLFCLALFSLRARGGTSEVMGVGLALMALTFSHPLGAAVAFAAVPLLALAVHPLLIARSPWSVTIALIFPTLFMALAFVYVSCIFPGDGWSLFVAPAQSLSLWRAAIARVFGDGFSGIPALDAALGMLLALVLSAPVAVVTLARVVRRRGLVAPVFVFVATVLAATTVCVAGGLFGDPTALVVAAPVLATAVLIRVPEAPARAYLVAALLALGWLGGAAGLALIDPITVGRLQAALRQSASDQADALAAGGAAADRDGVLADIDGAPALVLGRGGARGFLGPGSEQFALAMLFARIDTPFVAVPDPQSKAGADDRLDRAFPALFRQGLPGYRVVYQNNTWRLFAKISEATVPKK